MTGPRFIEHGGKRIVFFDFSQLTDAGEELRTIAAARAFVAALAASGPLPLKLLVLTDVEGSSFSQPVIDALNELAIFNKPHVRASAVIGLNALRRLVVRAVSLFSRRVIAAMESREQALDWLVRQ